MKKPVLLVAEDNALDALLLERVLERCGDVFQMVQVEDGEGVIDYLLGNGAYADRAAHPLPNLILLDLKMPRKDGFAVLRWRQETPAFIQVPVIVFSSSSLPGDVARAYTLGANSYTVKPSDPQRFEQMVSALQAWWTQFNIGVSPA
ncbi:MAG: response regulator [Verrucomicrobiota bacterium]